MWNGIQHSPLRLGPLIWLDPKWGEKTRKRNTLWKATLVILCVSVNDLCVHVPKEFSMWNGIQHSQLRLGSLNLARLLDEAKRPGSGTRLLKAP